MEDTTLDGFDGAQKGVTGEGMAEGLPASGILLIGVGEGHEGSPLHVIPRAVTSGGALGEGAAECSVLEMEGLAATAVGGGRESILARVIEEIEAEDG
jgi:hypothetical protein